MRRGTARRALASVFREPIDAIPVALIVAVAMLQVAIYVGIGDPRLVLLAVVAVFPLQLNMAGMCHNHHHHPTFRSAVLDRAFEVVMFFQLGMLPYGYTLHHNIGHHGHYLDQDTDTNRWRRVDGGTMGPWEFAWRLCLAMYPNVWRIGRAHPRLRRRFVAMACLCGAIFAGLLVHDPVNALLVFALPLLPALLLQAQATYHQHAGLATTDALRASRTVTDSRYNRRTFNLGYHAAHHLRPGLHWSKLPAFHARIADRLPADLVD
jgi:beta-carotene hydroxylase